jgi:hypothetical protein
MISMRTLGLWVFLNLSDLAWFSWRAGCWKYSQYEAIASLIHSNNPVAQQHIDQILTIFAQVLSTPVEGQKGAELSNRTRQGIIGLIKGLNSGVPEKIQAAGLGAYLAWKQNRICCDAREDLEIVRNMIDQSQVEDEGHLVDRDYFMKRDEVYVFLLKDETKGFFIISEYKQMSVFLV